MKITREQADRLKDKFYSATATPQEERQLARLLRSGECPEEWAGERRALLALLPEGAQALPEDTPVLPEGFGMRLATRLEQERMKTKRATRLRLFRWSAVAAMIVVVFGSVALWHRSATSADEQVLMEQTVEKTPVAEVTRVAPPADYVALPPAEPAEAVAPQVEKKKTVPAPEPKQQHRRGKARIYVAQKTTATVPPPAPATPEQQMPPPASGISTATAKSLNDHLRRTRQSRDRLVAEARNYLAVSCLNRNIPPQNPPTTETDK